MSARLPLVTYRVSSLRKALRDSEALCDRPLRIALLAGLLWTMPSPSSSQVNTEAFRPTGNEEGLSGVVSLTFAARRGNSESERAGLGLSLFRAYPFDVEEVEDASRPVPMELLSPRTLLLLVTKYDFEESRGDKTVNRGFAHLRWTRMVSPRVGWEAFGQIETDEFTRLDRRTLLGGGLRYGAYQRNNAMMFVGVGAMGEWERIDEAPALASVPSETLNVARITSYFNARWKNPSKRVELSTTTYVQPAVDDADDYRVLSQARVKTAITERLSLNLLVNLRHDSVPPEGIDTTDVEIKTGLSFAF